MDYGLANSGFVSLISNRKDGSKLALRVEAVRATSDYNEKKNQSFSMSSNIRSSSGEKKQSNQKITKSTSEKHYNEVYLIAMAEIVSPFTSAILLSINGKRESSPEGKEKENISSV